MSHTDSHYFSKARVETFSDGVFAIIVTLLVLEIKLPEQPLEIGNTELATALLGILPKVVSWVVSFFIVCVIWVNHHRIFAQVKSISHGFFWLNALLLLWCSFIPFPTALMGNFIFNATAQLVFGAVLACMALSFSLMRVYLLRHTQLLQSQTNLVSFKQATRNSFIYGPGLYTLGALCSLVHPLIAFGIYSFIPCYFIFSPTKPDRVNSNHE